MVEFLLDLLAFVVKGAIVMAVVMIPVIVLVSVIQKAKKKTALGEERGSLVVTDLKKKARNRRELMEKSLKRSNPEEQLHKKEIKSGLVKEDKEEAKKATSKQARKDKVKEAREERNALIKDIEERRAAGEFCPENLYVIDFRGSAKGSEFRHLRIKIEALLEVATKNDEVVVNLMSPGGLVNSYGLCASLLQRIRDREIYLTVTVDEVAASGGYLMACVANKIVAAPFSYIGSIGVIAGIPNFRKLLKKFDVDYEQITAGKFKRTLSVLGENTEEGRKKFKEELEAVHERFKEQVLRYRPQLDAEKIATGEHWLAVDARELGLVDDIITSDDYILKRMAVTTGSALKIDYRKQEKKTLVNRILPKGVLGSLFSSDKSAAEQAVDEIEQIEQSSSVRWR
ncbi:MULTISPECIES: protease SohB [unclassified Anaerobiospirillum]|uniref:protease SohB n=1 Tax=unclassified Anaerobiospirillum TaxID=2647410 RepID=UPI001FF2363F|nr:MULTISPECIES: protease SohB [unclassified Anaerobiospirillum]MCK0533680.1 protease SohB [Anaerobiospirillum sp. NML120511]MCK0539643.1 protease SohB [Anaerobiospirillum sp. NML02-A-032]